MLHPRDKTPPLEPKALVLVSSWPAFFNSLSVGWNSVLIWSKTSFLSTFQRIHGPAGRGVSLGKKKHTHTVCSTIRYRPDEAGLSKEMMFYDILGLGKTSGGTRIDPLVISGCHNDWYSPRFD